ISERRQMRRLGGSYAVGGTRLAAHTSRGVLGFRSWAEACGEAMNAPSTQYITGAVHVGDLIDVRLSASVRTASPTWRIGRTVAATLTTEQVSEPLCPPEVRTRSWYPAARSWFKLRSRIRVAWLTAALGLISALPGLQTELRAQNRLLVWSPQPVQPKAW